MAALPGGSRLAKETAWQSANSGITGLRGTPGAVRMVGRIRFWLKEAFDSSCMMKTFLGMLATCLVVPPTSMASNGKLTEQIASKGESVTQPTEARLPCIVDCYTTWCPFCKRFAPIFQATAEKFKGRIDFQCIDAEARSSRSFIRKHRPDGFPTLFYFDADGNQVKMMSGAPRSMPDFELTIAQTFPSFRQELTPELQQAGKLTVSGQEVANDTTDNREVFAADDAGVDALNNKDFKTAIASFEKALQIDPSYKPAREHVVFGYFNDAVNLYSSGKYAQALPQITKAMELAKKFSLPPDPEFQQIADACKQQLDSSQSTH
jgi:thioredoxin-like negative regulator of GroEL